ncbi:hypothetical protein LshimejAT787_0105920 [Lyophyllum shimeji]|uniref:Phospholipid/glycerol acyltransferase domain-containing protein n=1 Tax=Lyophyllum shimeji TaxID=47721 RepID=A0A9P3PE07_LYOSH|nr:hypothetical protein LshimejAT787_0105920 [Lyophyllum shimeji]
MEKFSAYRDPGTGIQPFLTPVPPTGTDLLAKVTLPLRYVVGVARTTLVLALLLLYAALVPGLCIIFAPIPALYRAIVHILTALIARTALLVLGFFWIPAEQVSRKRRRGQNQTESWNPQAGDVIVSNWVSWVEVLWLAFRFNPIFVLPVSETVHTLPASSQSSSPISHTPGRRTGTGSANVQTFRKTTAPPISILGFRRVSLPSMIRLTGQVPPYGHSPSDPPPVALEELRKIADRPIVVFPECTTSNGRGLLRFAKVFRQEVPVRRNNVFVMCVRYDPPTTMAPTLTLPIPSTSLNPLPHLFSLATSVSAPTISIRLLVPSESPSSQLFIVSEILTDFPDDDDQLAEVCATLIAQIGKMKRTGMGWEDKASFLDFYRGKQK